MKLALMTIIIVLLLINTIIKDDNLVVKQAKIL